MSSMLEQAIVDAKALREAALKNAEQAIIEKYAPEIKKAVSSLLEENTTKVKHNGEVHEVVSEVDGEKVAIKKEGEKPYVVNESEVQEMKEEDLLQEQEESQEEISSPDTGFQAPHAFNPLDIDESVKYNSKFEEPIYEFNLEDFEAKEETSEPEMELGDLATLQETQEQDEVVEQIMELLGNLEEQEEVLEEELIVDTNEKKHGWVTTDEGTREYDQELRLAKEESTKYKEENEALEKKLKESKESLKKLQLKNKQYKDVVEKINEKLNETLLSNAKLLYSNKTLCDASLNERQKEKIVEAIAKAKTPEEAKSLCEALNATVTSGNDRKKGPRTLSESVQRKSNLSSILPRRKSQANKSESHTFADKMKKLAGIK